jgi:hypothetical protein
VDDVLVMAVSGGGGARCVLAARPGLVTLTENAGMLTVSNRHR